jgi:hypothetical protein
MTAMTEEWVSLWYQCLTQNIDYSLYCGARDSGDDAKCAELEARFDKINDIYADFGTLDGWPEDGMQSRQWIDWFEPRRHLFMTEPRLVRDSRAYVSRPGYVLVEMPLQGDAKVAGAAVAALIERHCASGDALSAPAPKYALREVAGRLSHGLQQVRQACRSVARSYRYDPETFEELRHQEAVAAFVRQEIDNMGWTLDPKAREELARTGTLSEQRLESFKAMLNKCRRDFRAFASNTIRASFPDDRPFESNVLDLF